MYGAKGSQRGILMVGSISSPAVHALVVQVSFTPDTRKEIRLGSLDHRVTSRKFDISSLRTCKCDSELILQADLHLALSRRWGGRGGRKILS
jgi:hypothetical protein